MGWLEESKSLHHDNEAITNEIVAQAHLENYALKLFTYADQQDRAANFTKYVFCLSIYFVYNSNIGVLIFYVMALSLETLLRHTIQPVWYMMSW